MNIEPRKGFEASAVALRAMARLAAVARPTSRGRYGGHAGAYIRYCETNPPFWKAIFYVSFVFRNTYIVCRPGLQVGSFWKTNPPGGFLGASSSKSGFVLGRGRVDEHGRCGRGYRCGR